MKKILNLISSAFLTILASFTGTQVSALNMYDGTTDIYDGSQLHIAIVQVGPAIYRDVYITINDIVALNGGPVYVGIDTYDTTTNQLTVPDVLVGTTHYTNAKITIDKVVKVGRAFPNGVRVGGIDQFCYKVDCVASSDKLSFNYLFMPSEAPLPLPTNTKLSVTQQALVTKANSIINSVEGNVALIIIENGQIIMEHYHPLINSNTLLIGQSMSKSMTSMAIGQAMCTGLIPSLDTLARDVNPLVSGTSYGDSTIRQLLMMSSGGLLGSASAPGSPVGGTTIGNPTLPMFFDNLLQLQAYGSKQVMPDGTYLQPGTLFSYKVFDTLTLGFMFTQNGVNHFQDIFQNYIWKFFGAENNGYFIKDINGMPVTHNGFMATAKDWARVGQSISNILNKNNSDCFTNYLKAATTQQIENKYIGPLYDYQDRYTGYGYQFWTGGSYDLPGTVSMNGAWGQRVVVNAAKNRVMYYATYQLTPTTPTPAGSLDKMFAAW